MWFVFALLSAVFAALTSILTKVGIDGVNSNLATAIRTVVVVAMAWGMVFLTNTQAGISEISRKSWLFLILSGLATGAYLMEVFCYDLLKMFTGPMNWKSQFSSICLILMFGLLIVS